MKLGSSKLDIDMCDTVIEQTEGRIGLRECLAGKHIYCEIAPWDDSSSLGSLQKVSTMKPALRSIESSS